MRRLILCVALSLMLTGCQTPGDAQATTGAGQSILQVLHDFQEPWAENWVTENGKRIDKNPFWRFMNHTGGDWGRMGPAEDQIYHRDGAFCMGRPGDPTTEWGGLWLSPYGLATQDGKLTNLRAMCPAWIKPEYQPKAVALVIDVRGKARIKMELKGPNSNPVVLWEKTILVDTAAEIRRLRFPIPETIGSCKFINAVIEKGAVVELHQIALEVLFGESVSFPERTFLYSYAKAAACFDPASGLCSDRAHWPAEHFSSVASTGLFVLATAAAADLGLVSSEDARGILRRAYRTISSIPRGPADLLPHFVENRDGKGWVIVPPAEGQDAASAVEYSTIDSALCWISLLEAAWCLREVDVYASVLKDIRAVDFSQLYADDGYISHGFRQDGKRIESVWDSFGGETALVIILARLAQGDEAKANMKPNGGRVFRGIGFISEVGSLLLPFDSPEPDAVSGVNWLASRKQLLEDQMAYFAGSPAHALGVFGLSATEGPNGVGYVAQGPDEVEVELIAPHMILMSAGLRDDPQAVYRTLAALQQRGLFTPLGGLVENVTPDLSTSLPMLGSLNGCFEALSAQALLCRTSSRPNPVYTAAMEAPELRKAVQVFYPAE